MEIKEIHDGIITWIKDWFKDKPTAKVIVGISGGKDSTVCAALLAEALGKENVYGVMMPNGIQKDISDSKRVIEFLGINSLTVNIGLAYEALSNAIDSNFTSVNSKSISMYTTNTPARLRMTTLYGIAAMLGGFVVNTCNFSEDYVGYSSKYGDAAGDFSLLCKLTKTEVVELGDYMGLPKDLVHKAPSDGMCGKTDEDNMGFTYDTLDQFLLTSLRPKSKEVWNKIRSKHNHPNTALKLIPMPHPEVGNSVINFADKI